MQVEPGVGNDLAHEAEAVRMDSGGGNAHQDVPGLDFGTIDQLGLFHDSGSESGDVIFPVSIHSRHLGGLSAYKGAAGLAAAFGDSGDNGFHNLRTGLALGHVIQEEQGLGTLCQHIIHAHGHSIDSYGVVLVHCERQLQLGSDTVGPADQYWFAVAQRREVEHAPERAYAAHDSRAGR